MKRVHLIGRSGKIIGQRLSIGDNALYLNRNGGVVGVYKKSVDKTFSAKNGFYAKGDIGQRLV